MHPLENPCQSNVCYTPTTFQPSNTALLSIGQWQMVQLYLADAQNLNIGAGGTTNPAVLAIYTRLKTQAIQFSGAVLPAAQLLGNHLSAYGAMSKQSFGAIADLMDADTPNKTAIAELLGNLRSTAVTYQAKSEDIFKAVSAFITESQQDVADLKAAAAAELAKAAKDNTQITQLNLDYQSAYADKIIAQSNILHDQKVIDDTKYYSWVPFVGTAVSVGEIIAHEHDIKEQIARINADVAVMQQTTAEMNALRADISELTYTAKYNTAMAQEISSALGSLDLIKGAWGTIVQELGDVIANVQNATAEALKDNPCLSAVSLATAAVEWGQVADDAESFALNFYIQPKAG